MAAITSSIDQVSLLHDTATLGENGSAPPVTAALDTNGSAPDTATTPTTDSSAPTAATTAADASAPAAATFMGFLGTVATTLASGPAADTEAVAPDRRPDPRAATQQGRARTKTPEGRRGGRAPLAELERVSRHRLTKWRAEVAVQLVHHYAHVCVDCSGSAVPQPHERWQAIRATVPVSTSTALLARPYARSVMMLELHACENLTGRAVALCFDNRHMQMCRSTALASPISCMLPCTATYTRPKTVLWRKDPFQGLGAEALLLEYSYAKYNSAAALLAEIEFNGDSPDAVVCGAEQGSALFHSAFRRAAERQNNIDKVSLALVTRRQMAALAEEDEREMLRARRAPRLYADNLDFTVLLEPRPAAGLQQQTINLWFNVAFHEIHVTQLPQQQPKK